MAATDEVAWRRLDAVPLGEQALPWLLPVALNQLRNHRRKGLRQLALLECLRSPGSAAAPEPADVTWRDIRAALDTLTSDDRELVLLVAWDGLSPAEAASVLGITPTAARSRLHRGRLTVPRRRRS